MDRPVIFSSAGSNLWSRRGVKKKNKMNKMEKKKINKLVEFEFLELPAGHWAKVEHLWFPHQGTDLECPSR